MKIIYSGKNLQITEEMKQQTEKQLEKLDKFFDEEITANVTISQFRDNKEVEITVNLPGAFIRAEECSPDFRTALDQAIDVLVRQVRKHKTKLQQRYRNKDTIRYENIPDYDQSDEESYDILREKTFSIIPMSEEEAKLQMELIGHDFFIFNNSSTDEVNVLYKRNKGGYGLLRPER